MPAAQIVETLCDRVQLMLVAGERAPEIASHLGDCSECQFFEGLSKNLSGLASLPSANGPLGAAFTAALATAIEHGKPLLDRYRLEALLGRGGQAEVYRAVDLETHDLVAIKLVRMPPGAEERTAAEVTHARRVAHPNVCRVFHTERYGAMRLIVMEYITGPTLATCLPTRDRRQAIEWFVAIAGAIRAAHAAGILHLDLKPANVLFRSDGAPVVTDFGLSITERDARAQGGTPAYMAPEQHAHGRVDRRTDIYALGRLLGLLVERPGRRLARIVERATANDPADRYRDVDALIRAVTPRWRGRYVVWVAATFVGIATLLVAIAALVPPPTRARPWRTDLWGIDAIAEDAVNVALNPTGKALPAASASPAFACARSTRELLDGVTQYSSWEHGFAFPPAEPICISLDSLAPRGTCGEPRDDASLCEHAGGALRVLDTRVVDRDRIAEPARSRLGQLEPGVPCGERTVTIDLDDMYDVVGVRMWNHHPEHAPAKYRIEVEDGGQRRVAFSTQLSHAARRRRDYAHSRGSGESAPITAELAAVATRRVNVIFDTCTLGELDAHDVVIGKPGHGWLYEVEVFARVGNLARWWRYLTGR